MVSGEAADSEAAQASTRRRPPRGVVNSRSVRARRSQPALVQIFRNSITAVVTLSCLVIVSQPPIGPLEQQGSSLRAQRFGLRQKVSNGVHGDAQPA